jgi:hypothetical protein
LPTFKTAIFKSLPNADPTANVTAFSSPLQAATLKTFPSTHTTFASAVLATYEETLGDSITATFTTTHQSSQQTAISSANAHALKAANTPAHLSSIQSIYHSSDSPTDPSTFKQSHIAAFRYAFYCPLISIDLVTYASADLSAHR